MIHDADRKPVTGDRRHRFPRFRSDAGSHQVALPGSPVLRYGPCRIDQDWLCWPLRFLAVCLVAFRKDPSPVAPAARQARSSTESTVRAIAAIGSGGNPRPADRRRPGDFHTSETRAPGTPGQGRNRKAWPRESCYDSNACSARAACAVRIASRFISIKSRCADCRGSVVEGRTGPFPLAVPAALPPRRRRLAFSGDEGVQFVASGDRT